MSLSIVPYLNPWDMLQRILGLASPRRHRATRRIVVKYYFGARWY